MRRKERTADVTSILELDHVSKMNECSVGISTILLRKKAREIETVQIRDAPAFIRKYKFSWNIYFSRKYENVETSSVV